MRIPLIESNLASVQPAVCMEGVYHLNEWHDQMMASMEHDVDPLWTVMHEGGPHHAKPHHLRYYAEFLRATGRSWAVDELKLRHPGVLD